ncbi:MAG: hypothetical protein ACREFZ_10585, partial [Acetobacteraceae bacterium]
MPARLALLRLAEREAQAAVSPARAELAARISATDAAEKAAADTGAAIERLLQERMAAAETVEKARQALVQAEQDAPQRIVDEMLGTTTERPKSIAEARAELAGAEERHALLRHASELLESKSRQARGSRELCDGLLNDAMIEVLKGSPAIGKLVSETEALHGRLMEKAAALLWLFQIGVIGSPSSEPVETPPASIGYRARRLRNCIFSP